MRLRRPREKSLSYSEGPSPWPSSNPLFVIISGPSGVGKDAVLAGLRSPQRRAHFVVTATTRPLRPGETEGKDYFFLSVPVFKERVEREEFLEWAEVYGNLYGVPKAQVKEALTNGLDVFVRTDVQGAQTLKKVAPQGVFIFLAPSSVEELERRLIERSREPLGEIRQRLEAARREMETLSIFDYLVINRQGSLNETVAKMEAILTAERCRIPPRRVEL